jgi:hypothetical protein
MALNSSPRRRFGVALGVVMTGVAAGLIGFAGIAGAHTPTVTAECKGDTTTLKVNLTAYRAEQDNHVKITDGADVLEDKAFKNEYTKSFDSSGAVDHTFRVVVTAWDDAKFNYDKEIVVAKCVVESTTTEPTETTTEPTETTTTEPTETTTTEPPTSSTEPPATTTVAPTTTTTAVDEGALAETGASIAVPLGIAAVLLVGGGVALFVVRRRGKA